MAANRTLPEQDHRAGKDVCPFNGNTDRQLLISTPQEIRRAEANTLTANNVHAIGHHLTPAFGHVILGNRRRDRRLLAKVHRPCRHSAHGVHHVGERTDPSQRLFDPFETPNRHLELAPNAGITAHSTCRHLRHPGVRSRQ